MSLLHNTNTRSVFHLRHFSQPVIHVEVPDGLNKANSHGDSVSLKSPSEVQTCLAARYSAEQSPPTHAAQVFSWKVQQVFNKKHKMQSHMPPNGFRVWMMSSLHSFIPTMKLKVSFRCYGCYLLHSYQIKNQLFVEITYLISCFSCYSSAVPCLFAFQTLSCKMDL